MIIFIDMLKDNIIYKLWVIKRLTISLMHTHINMFYLNLIKNNLYLTSFYHMLLIVVIVILLIRIHYNILQTKLLKKCFKKDL